MTRYGGSPRSSSARPSSAEPPSSPSPKSKTCATLGCTSIAACCASSRKRRRNVGSPACSSRSTLTATDRPRTRSSAHHTSPIPPTASRSISRYRPPRASEGALVTSLPYPPCASGHTCVSYRNRRDSGSVLLTVKPPLVIATASLAAVLVACGTQTAGDTTLAALQLTDAGAPAEAAPAQAGGANGAYGFVLQTTLPATTPPAAPVWRLPRPNATDARQVAGALGVPGTPTAIPGGWLVRDGGQRLAVRSDGSWTWGMDCSPNVPVQQESLDVMCANASTGGGVAVAPAPAGSPGPPRPAPTPPPPPSGP